MGQRPAIPAIVLAVGTRPEAIKLAEVHRALEASTLEHELWSTGQHRGLLDQTATAVGVEPDLDLDIMVTDQSLDHVLTTVVSRFGSALDDRPPAIVVVQGDTTTALGCALAAFHRRIPVAHVEAGLRSGHPDPFPEEANRALIDRLATLHFAPTAANAENLRNEGVAESGIHVVGNPGLDTLRTVLEAAGPADHTGDGPVVVTDHRRENHGAPLRRVFAATRMLAERIGRPVTVAAHPNPAVTQAIDTELAGVHGVDVVDPVDYPAFVRLLRDASLVLTDSGGILEEAAYLGRPVLVLRDHTERPEGLTTGHSRLVGTDPAVILNAAAEWLDAESHGDTARAPCPYGDGHTAPRVVEVIAAHLADGGVADPATRVA
jgi:UDP-N-acetylglucosamine 2-epimerase (non-hydrolysing)